MKNRTLIGLAAASVIAIAGSATATTIGHFAPAGGAGGLIDAYVGSSGVSNDNMVIDAPGNGITLGLKSHERFVGDWGAATLDGDRGVYTVQPGLGLGAPDSNPTKWSYLYAVDFGTGVSAGDYGIRVKLDFDATDGDVAPDKWYVIELEGNSDTMQGDSQTMGFDWYNPSNPIWGGFDIESAGIPWPTGATAYFSGTGNYLDIDPNAAGRYDVEIEVYNITSGEIVADVAMSVIVVPLPPAAWAGLAGLAGAAVMRRRFTK